MKKQRRVWPWVKFGPRDEDWETIPLPAEELDDYEVQRLKKRLGL